MRSDPKPIEGVIWDVDGTLTNSLALCVSGLRSAIEAVGGPRMTEQEVIATFGPTEEGILRTIVGDRWEDAIEIYLGLYEEGHASDGLVFEDVVAQVHRLAEAGVRQVVVTGKGARSAEISLRYAGLDAVFDRVVPGSMKGSIKRDAISSIMADWDLPSGTVAYVGDHASDVRQARAAGAVPLSAAWDAAADLEALLESEPRALLRTPAELHVWLGANVAGLDE